MLTAPQASVLQALDTHGPLAPKHLARKAERSNQSVSRTLPNLESQGLIRIARKRGDVVDVTAKGKRELRRHNAGRPAAAAATAAVEETAAEETAAEETTLTEAELQATATMTAEEVYEHLSPEETGTEKETEPETDTVVDSGPAAEGPDGAVEPDAEAPAGAAEDPTSD